MTNQAEVFSGIPDSAFERLCRTCISPEAFDSPSAWALEISRQTHLILGMDMGAVIFPPSIEPRVATSEFTASLMKRYLETDYLKLKGERERWRRRAIAWTRDDNWDQKVLRKSEYWHSVIVPSRYYDACGMAVRLTEEHEGVLYAGRDRERSISAGGREKAILQRLQPYFAAGMRFLALTAELPSSFLSGLDAGGGAMLAIDGNGRVIHATNRWLTEELILIEGDRKKLRQAAMGLGREISRVMRGASLAVAAPSVMVPTSIGTYTISATSSIGLRHLGEDTALLALSAPISNRRLAQLAGQRHGLTNRQVDVAFLLLEGQSPREIAQRLGIALNTARRHLEALYARLAVHGSRQAERALRDQGS